MLFVFALPTKRSNYPPDTPFGSVNCQVQGPVRACVINRGYLSSGARLYINYDKSGVLTKDDSPLQAWVDINGKQVTTSAFTLSADGNSSYYNVNGWTNMRMCYRPSETDPADKTFLDFERCPVTDRFPLLPASEGGRVGYYWDYAPKEEEDTIKAAGSGSWTVQIALFNTLGHWDSIFGKNYRFTFA